MGLSDTERLRGCIHAVRHLNTLSQEFQADYRIDSYEKEKLTHLIELIDQTWHAMFGSHSNSFHWFMGSESSNEIHGNPTGPWAVAVVGHLEQYARERDEIIRPSEDYKSPFNACEFNNIPNLLQNAGDAAESYVFKIYQWAEQLAYFLRRYDDQFTKNHHKLNVVLSKIIGECFTHFTRNEMYAKAYVIYQIMEIVYGTQYPYNSDQWDFVTTTLSKGNMHHDFPRLMKREVEMEFLAGVHIELIKHRYAAFQAAEKRNNTPSYGQDEGLLLARCHAMIKVIPELCTTGKKKFLEDLKKSALNKNYKELAATVEERSKAIKDVKPESKEDYHLEDLSAYGFTGDSILWDFAKDCKKKTEKVVNKPVKKTVKRKSK